MSLDIAFDPARALADPVPQAAVGFFPGGRIQDLGAVAFAVQPDAQVAVFGHVERVPAAEPTQHVGLEMVARPAQRDRHAHYVQPRQKQIEPDRILQREPLGQVILPGVVVVQLALQADDFGAFVAQCGALGVQPAKGCHGLLELIAFRAVFGVVDHQVFAPRIAQSVVAGLWLGFGLRMGNHDHVHTRRQMSLLTSLPGLRVVLFQKQLDVKFVLGIIQPADGVNNLGGDFGLFVHRYQDRIDRQFVVVEVGQFRLAHLQFRSEHRREQHGQELVADDRNIQGADGEVHDRQEDLAVIGEQHQQGAGYGQVFYQLPIGEDPGGRLVAVGARGEERSDSGINGVRFHVSLTKQYRSQIFYNQCRFAPLKFCPLCSSRFGRH